MCNNFITKKTAVQRHYYLIFTLNCSDTASHQTAILSDPDHRFRSSFPIVMYLSVADKAYTG